MTATTARRPPRGGEPVGLAARRVAWKAVRRVHEDDAWASPAVDAALDRSDLDERDKAFAANLAFETLRWEGTLDWLLSGVVNRDLAEVEPALLDVLRLGAWQVRYGRVPDRAAVDTSVELARRQIGARTAGFVNGVLRSLVRSAPSLPAGTDAAAVGLALGMPAWTVELARERFGERAEAVLAAGNVPPGLVLRADVGGADHRAAGQPSGGAAGVPPRRSRRDALLDELTGQGWDVKPGVHPLAVRVPAGVAGRVDAVLAGRATVQDEASMHVVDAVLAALDFSPDDEGPALVVDVCAGPGGKATGLWQAGATVVAADHHPGRTRLVTDLAARGGGLAAQPAGLLALTAEAARPALRPGCADAVLVDAPCTGLGVVRRRPELRWRRQATDPPRLAGLQLDLLLGSADLVRPGGALIYSVCTWTDVETRGVVESFLTARPGWVTAPPALPVGTMLPGDPGVQLASDLDGTDGMYVAVFRPPT